MQTLTRRREQTAMVAAGAGVEERKAVPARFCAHDKWEQSDGKLQVLFRFVKARLSGFVPH